MPTSAQASGAQGVADVALGHRLGQHQPRILASDARTALETYLANGRPALVGDTATDADQGYLFLSDRDHRRPLGMNALSLMLTRRYHAGGGALRSFGLVMEPVVTAHA